VTETPDPILRRRAQYARLVGVGKRVGYLLLLIAVVAFVIGFPLGFPQAAVTVSVVGLIGTCVVLPPAIIFGYAVKAAEREDRKTGRL
jgi:hypothetical protein